MFTRLIKKPTHSAFLMGPRGTGKSTWIRANFKDAVSYDLLNTEEALRFNRHPHSLYQETRNLAPGSWVIIDEVQKAPAVLDEVQRLIEEKRLKFLLSGSSARKLKRGAANLLAGRAVMKPFFPLVSSEVDFKIGLEGPPIEWGMLPMAFNLENPKDYLRTYATSYLQEEVKAEALTRNIGSFARFLEVAARQNAQVTNMTSIARDAQVARQTVEAYFEILVDTLIGSWLPSWKLKRATKQVRHPKFYFFDAGVCRALSGRLPYPPLEEETGFLLETLILNELRAYLSYSGLNYPVHYWSSYDGVEVDFLVEDSRGYVALKVKSSASWRGAFQRGLSRLIEELGAQRVRAYGVFGGVRPQGDGTIPILPLGEFLRMLWDGGIIR
jgi:predicted AAA+ superfamily ATPase